MIEVPLPAPLWRRLAAALYDAFLLLAVWMVALALELALRQALALERNLALQRAGLFLLGLAFCGWFWTHGGQTLGMRAWRLQLRRSDGRPVGWTAAAVRYAGAWLAWLPLGAGVLWCLVDPQRRAWHDRLSGTEVILLPRATREASPRAGP